MEDSSKENKETSKEVSNKEVNSKKNSNKEIGSKENSGKKSHSKKKFVPISEIENALLPGWLTRSNFR